MSMRTLSRHQIQGLQHSIAEVYATGRGTTNVDKLAEELNYVFQGKFDPTNKDHRQFVRKHSKSKAQR